MLLPGPPVGVYNTMYYCTKFVPRKASLAPTKGGNAGIFFPAIRGHVPVASIAPTKGGDAGIFFLAIRGHVPAKLRHRPHREGEMLSVFLRPLLERCKAKISFSPSGLFVVLDAALILKIWSFDSKSFKIKAASRPQMLRCHSNPPHVRIPANNG